MNMTKNSVLFHIYIMNFVLRHIYHLSYQRELPKNRQKLKLVPMIYLLNEVDISDQKFHEQNENATFVRLLKMENILCFFVLSLMIYDQSKKISNDQELIQSDPSSCPQNQKGNN